MVLILVCALIFAVLVPAQLLILLIYVRRRAPLVLRSRPITPYLCLAFLLFRCVNSFIEEGYRLSVRERDSTSTAIFLSEFFYVWAFFFLIASAQIAHLFQQVVMRSRIEANKQALFRLSRQSVPVAVKTDTDTTATASTTASTTATSTAAARLTRLIRFQRVLASRPIAITALVILFSMYLVACVTCVTLYYTVISAMGETAMENFIIGMELTLICMPALLFSITGVLFLLADTVAACVDITHMRRDAVPWSKIGPWLLGYVIDRPHYLRLETITILVFPVIGTVYIIMLLLGMREFSTIVAWIMNFVILLYPGGGILVLAVLVGDVRRLHEQRTAGTGHAKKNSALWQEEEEDFRTYMTRVLMSVGDGSKNAQMFLGMMQQSKKEYSTEVSIKHPSGWNRIKVLTHAAFIFALW